VIEERTLFITQDYLPDRGGIARVYGELCTRMHRVDVSTVAPLDAPAAIDARVHRMPFTIKGAHRPVNILRWTRWARRFVKEHDVALVHAGNVRPSGYVAAMLRRGLGVPYTVYVHGKDLLKERRKGTHRPLVRAGTREILGNAAAIIANSAATAALARELVSGVGRVDAADRVRVVHPGADPSRFTDVFDPAHHHRPDAREGPVLLSVARLVPRKGIDTVIEALPAILAAHPRATYVVVGSGPDLARLRQLADSIGVASHVRFAGDVSDDDLPAYYGAADVFVLPTREILADDEIEGFGIAYVEASAAGVPCIASDVGGVADAVRDGVTGILLPPGSAASAASFAGAALRLLGDPSLRAQLGAGGRQVVEQELNWDRAAREVIGLVSEVTRRGSRRAAGPSDSVLQPDLRGAGPTPNASWRSTPDGTEP